MLWHTSVLAYSSLLAAAGTLVSGAPQNVSSLRTRADDDCAWKDFFDDRMGIGAEKGGVYKCLSFFSSGAFPQELEARADEHMLRWLRIGYSDGSYQEVGIKPDNDDRAGYMKWNPWATNFAYFTIWDGGWDAGAGPTVSRLSLRLDSCPTDDCDMDSGAYMDMHPHDAPHGSDKNGMLLGFTARHGDGVDWLQPIFSKTGVDRVIIRDATFSPTIEELNQRPFAERGLQALSMTHTLDNRGSEGESDLWIDSSITATVQHTVSVANEDGHEYEHTLGLGYRGEVRWEGRIPFFGGVGGSDTAEVNYQYRRSHIVKSITGDQNSTSEEVSVRFRVRHLVPGGKITTCTTTVLQSRLDLRFSGWIENRFVDSKYIAYPISGVLEDANHSDATTVCVDGDPGAGDSKAVLEPGEPTPGAITSSGTYCPDGKKVADGELSDAEYKAACPR